MSSKSFAAPGTAFSNSSAFLNGIFERNFEADFAETPGSHFKAAGGRWFTGIGYGRAVRDLAPYETAAHDTTVPTGNFCGIPINTG